MRYLAGAMAVAPAFLQAGFGCGRPRLGADGFGAWRGL